MHTPGFVRFVVVALAAVFSFVPALAQQPAGDVARFEAVSIKRHDPGSVSDYQEYPGGRIVSRGQRSSVLISRAYGVRGTRLIGGPDWVRSDPYTIETTATGKPDDAQLKAMLRQMLSERYKLVVHTERRDMPTYVLTVARPGRLGPNLKPRVPPCERDKPVAPETISLPMPEPSGAARPPRPCGTRMAGGRILSAVGITMQTLAQAIDSYWLNEPVIDATGLTGEYDVLLTNIVNQWTNNPLKAEADDPDAARLPVALEDQLGLKLELRREPADVVIIDRIERPSEN
jgi:uncharacterized protein (TIGR03435 family)